MKAFAYSSATDLDDAVARVNRSGNGSGVIRPLAGGTDLLTLLKADIVALDELVDIKRADGLQDRIQVTDHETVLGALVTLAQIEAHPGLRERFPALVEAASLAASPQLRNMATIGGNLLQRPRCWYYRSAQFHCWLKGGEECFARDGENQHHALFGQSPCVAAHPSDPAAALLALDASIVARDVDGERAMPLGDFFAEPDEDRRTENVLAAGEILTEIRIPGPQPGARSTYLKAMDRKVWAFALVGVAASARLEDGVIRDPRIVLSGAAPIPWRVPEAEAVLDGRAPEDALFAQAAEVALEQALPLARNGYKVPLANALIRRALAAVTR
jgi:xanthine dehydrogenase YagS FAD-binding subunit